MTGSKLNYIVDETLLSGGFCASSSTDLFFHAAGENGCLEVPGGSRAEPPLKGMTRVGSPATFFAHSGPVLRIGPADA
jgi:hypothetical protein